MWLKLYYVFDIKIVKFTISTLYVKEHMFKIDIKLLTTLQIRLQN